MEKNEQRNQSGCLVALAMICLTVIVVAWLVVR